ncbi:endonuclease III [candidate division WOR-3 bacterium]|nr:endonuclease III [candidate division WOR-3 bacterium]
MNLNIQNTGKEKSNLSSTKKVKLLINVLKKRYRLNNRTKAPYRVLISTLLSQRTRDETTALVSSSLFLNYKKPEDFISLTEKEIASLIKPVGFYKVKARRIKEISSILIEKWDSKVPSTLEELLSLPGIGRKTANCVLAFGFGIPALPVDTHVHRISNRLGLVNTRTPYETEDALTQIVPQEYWGWLNKALVEFGKEICKPIKPRCSQCKLSSICKSVAK